MTDLKMHLKYLKKFNILLHHENADGTNSGFNLRMFSVCIVC